MQGKEYERAQNGTRLGKGNVPDARGTPTKPDEEAEAKEKQPAEKGQVVRREPQRRKGKEQNLKRCVKVL